MYVFYPYKKIIQLLFQLTTLKPKSWKTETETENSKNSPAVMWGIFFVKLS